MKRQLKSSRVLEEGRVNMRQDRRGLLGKAGRGDAHIAPAGYHMMIL